jgi:hypothetical protein
LVVVVGVAALTGLAATPWGWVLEHPEAGAAGSWLLRAWGAWTLMVLALQLVPAWWRRRLLPIELVRWGGLGASAIAADSLGHALLGGRPSARTVAAAAALGIAGTGILAAEAIAGAVVRARRRTDGLADPAFVADASLMVAMHVVGMPGPMPAAAFGGSMLLARERSTGRVGAVGLAAAGTALALWT